MNKYFNLFNTVICNPHTEKVIVALKKKSESSSLPVELEKWPHNTDKSALSALKCNRRGKHSQHPGKVEISANIL